jgi:tRNA1(Val) A37 N6-methylase TrmN6
LIDKYIESKEIKTIVDFGCGKGAVLIYLAKKLDIKGLGVDIVPEFIDSANKHAYKNSINNRLYFVTGDLLEYLEKKVNLML